MAAGGWPKARAIAPIAEIEFRLRGMEIPSTASMRSIIPARLSFVLLLAGVWSGEDIDIHWFCWRISSR
jgi:hypothetical protein